MYKVRNPSSVPRQMSTSGILALVNPERSPYIELEDMVTDRQKSILDRLPGPLKQTVRSVFQGFIFGKRSFFMTPEEFEEAYRERRKSESISQAKIAIFRTFEIPERISRSGKEVCDPQPSKTHWKSLAHDVSMQSYSSHSSHRTRECTPVQSPLLARDRSYLSNLSSNDLCDRSGSQSPLDRSYAELHEKKKVLQKQIETRDLVTAVKLDSELKKVRSRSPSLVGKQGGKGGKPALPERKWRGGNAKELIEIRRRHLSSQSPAVVFH